MSLLSVESLLKHLRTPSDGKFLFDDYLSDAWEIFQFDGEPDLASFEGFLIETVFQVFDEAEQNRENAKKRDACLVGLGLLEKCYHNKTDSRVPAHCDIATRCVSYLSGDYIKLSYPVPEEGANYNITDSRSLPRQALDQSARRARKQLSKRLTYMAACGKESCQKCLQAGIENHTELITVSDGESERTIRQVILPPPCYTLKNFPISEQQPAPEIQQDTHPEGTEDSGACGDHEVFSGQNTDLDENISGGTIESELPDASSCSTSNGSSGTPEDEKVKLSSPSPEISKSAADKTTITSDEETVGVKTTDEHVHFENVAFQTELSPPKTQGGTDPQSFQPSIGGLDTDRNSPKDAKPNRNLTYLAVCSFLLIAVALIKMAFFSTDALVRPESSSYPSNSSEVSVEKIICEKSPFTVYPGEPAVLPIKIAPNTATGTYLYCSSSDSNILYTSDGYEAAVEAWYNSDSEVANAQVTVTIIPQNRVSSDVYAVVPVVVDYTVTVPVPTK